MTGYYLWIGSTPGGYDLVNIGPLSGTSTTINLPTNGATVYVRLWTLINGSTFLYNNYTLRRVHCRERERESFNHWPELRQPTFPCDQYPRNRHPDKRRKDPP